MMINGLFMSPYFSYGHSMYNPPAEHDTVARIISSKKIHHHSWPRRKTTTRRSRLMKTMEKIQNGKAISEMNLDVISKSKKFNSFIQDVNWDWEDTAYLSKQLNEQKANHISKEYDSKIQSHIDLSTKNHLCTKKSCCNDIMTHDHSENKLGIITLLKNWKINKNQYEKNNHIHGLATNDTCSSISSINTLTTESDNFSLCSDSLSSTRILRKSEYCDKIISSSHLIQLGRPENLPPKPLSEQVKHQKEYEKMITAIKKKERDNDVKMKKKHESQLKKEEKLSQSTHAWSHEIIPHWDQKKYSKRTFNLWWEGIPSTVRGKVWSLSLGNPLNITEKKYKECVERSKNILKKGSLDWSQLNKTYEDSVDLIRLDISRTFPSLGFFQNGGPYFNVLHQLLGAYVCYQPEIGYVQGMSFIAAVLLLNMDELDAFICFANMMNNPLLKVFYSLDLQKMKSYYLVFSDLMRVNMHDLYIHVNETRLSPDLYLVDWIYTLFSKSMNLDITCRIWDLMIRDGETFIFRAALGIMHMFKSELLKLDFWGSAQFLTKLPEDLCADKLFKSISCVRMQNGALTFHDMLSQYS